MKTIALTSLVSHDYDTFLVGVVVGFVLCAFAWFVVSKRKTDVVDPFSSRIAKFSTAPTAGATSITTESVDFTISVDGTQHKFGKEQVATILSLLKAGKQSEAISELRSATGIDEVRAKKLIAVLALTEKIKI